MSIGDFSKKSPLGYWKSGTGIFIDVLKDVKTLSSAKGRHRRETSFSKESYYIYFLIFLSISLFMVSFNYIKTFICKLPL